MRSVLRHDPDVIMTDEIRDLIIKKAGAREIKQLAIKQGMRTLRMNGLLKAREGITTLEEVLACTSSDGK